MGDTADGTWGSRELGAHIRKEEAAAPLKESSPADLERARNWLDKWVGIVPETVTEFQNSLATEFAAVRESSPVVGATLHEAIMWNPYNKVVQDHRDGTIHDDLTNFVRKEIGLPIPWTPELGEKEVREPARQLVHRPIEKAVQFIRDLSNATTYRSHDLGYEDSITMNWKEDAKDILAEIEASASTPAAEVPTVKSQPVVREEGGLLKTILFERCNGCRTPTWCATTGKCGEASTSQSTGTEPHGTTVSEQFKQWANGPWVCPNDSKHKLSFRGYHCEECGIFTGAPKTREEILTFLITEREMHNAWRKRAEEAEAELIALKQAGPEPPAAPATPIVIDGHQHEYVWLTERWAKCQCGAEIISSGGLYRRSSEPFAISSPLSESWKERELEGLVAAVAQYLMTKPEEDAGDWCDAYNEMHELISVHFGSEDHEVWKMALEHSTPEPQK